MNAEDRDWFDRLLQACIQEFGCSFEEAVPCQPVLYGDFMIPGANNKVYTLIEDREKVRAALTNNPVSDLHCRKLGIILCSASRNSSIQFSSLPVQSATKSGDTGDIFNILSATL